LFNKFQSNLGLSGTTKSVQQINVLLAHIVCEKPVHLLQNTLSAVKYPGRRRTLVDALSGHSCCYITDQNILLEQTKMKRTLYCASQECPVNLMHFEIGIRGRQELETFMRIKDFDRMNLYAMKFVRSSWILVRCSAIPSAVLLSLMISFTRAPKPRGFS
jgi:hypothetical protein